MKRYRFDYDISLEGWQTGGLPPEDVVAFLKSKGIPIKEEYRELLYLLQVPEVWRMIIGRSRLLVNQYKNQNKRRKL